MAKGKDPQENGQEAPEAKASKIREAAGQAELEKSLRRLAAGAKARESELRGGARFKPRGDLGMDEVEVHPSGEGPAPGPSGPMDEEVLEDVSASLGEALQATAEFAAVQYEVTPPDEEMAERVGRAWVRVLRVYGKIDPRAATVVAATTTTVAWAGPSALEAWLKYQERQREAAEEWPPERREPQDGDGPQGEGEG